MKRIISLYFELSMLTTEIHLISVTHSLLWFAAISYIHWQEKKKSSSSSFAALAKFTAGKRLSQTNNKIDAPTHTYTHTRTYSLRFRIAQYQKITGKKATKKSQNIRNEYRVWILWRSWFSRCDISVKRRRKNHKPKCIK